MINIIKPYPIQSSKTSQNYNQGNIHEERTINVLGVAGSVRHGSYSTRVKNGIRRSEKI